MCVFVLVGAIFANLLSYFSTNKGLCQGDGGVPPFAKGFGMVFDSPSRRIYEEGIFVVFVWILNQVQDDEGDKWIPAFAGMTGRKAGMIEERYL
jgi:hypothetical protein